MFSHRHRIDSSPLAALLQQWTHADGGTPAVRPDVAEQLGQWLTTVDAVNLGRSLHRIEAMGDAGGQIAVDIVGLQAAVTQARSELARAVAAGPAPGKPSRERADGTPALPDMAEQTEFAFHAPRYLGLQKQIDVRLRALRAQLRQALGQGTGRLQQLAALDAALEQALAAREQRLWASLPAQLDRRLAQLRERHQQQLASLAQDDDPQLWQNPGGWLHGFEQDLQALLLAEMQVRLQPILGLLEAARAEYMESTE